MLKKEQTKIIKLQDKNLNSTFEKIQRCEIVTSEELNLLWDNFLLGKNLKKVERRFKK